MAGWEGACCYSMHFLYALHGMHRIIYTLLLNKERNGFNVWHVDFGHILTAQMVLYSINVITVTKVTK